jgi:Lhr-like helicase
MDESYPDYYKKATNKADENKGSEPKEDIPPFVLKHWQEWKDGTIDKDGKRKWKYYFMKYGLLPRNPKRINKYMTPEEKERLREENKKRRKEIYKKVAALCKSEELQNIRTV